ncbi:MAG: heme exporter protein CcmB [Spirochaetes bacterium]|nr:heme exporter protein CcmB [Spirochaetota bacterium]
MVSEIIRNLAKDLRVEFRSRFAINISLAFAVIATLALSLATGGIPFPPRVQSVLLWLIIFFSAMNGLSHIFVREDDRGTSLFLLVSTTSDAIYLSKLIYNLIFMSVLLAVITPLFVFFLQVNILGIPPFIISVLTGGLSITAVTTILAAMVAKSGGKGPLFTIISFPLLLPVLWLSIFSTAATLESTGPHGYGTQLFLLAFSGFITALSFLLFRFVWLDE